MKKRKKPRPKLTDYVFLSPTECFDLYKIVEYVIENQKNKIGEKNIKISLYNKLLNEHYDVKINYFNWK